MVKLLLAKEGIDPNSKDRHDRTPLSFAVENGHEAVVKLLLAKDGVDLNYTKRRSQTALGWAATNGRRSTAITWRQLQ